MPPNDQRWDARLEELKEFRREHGHCDVPERRPGGLGLWVMTQRTARKQGRGWMDAHRIRKLDEEGFRWAVVDDRDDWWDARLEELKQFRREHGHCDVPQRHPGGLGWWAKRQREDRRQGKRCLDARRIRLLEEEGFQWRAGRGHGSRRTIASGGSGGNEEEDGRGSGAPGRAVPKKERGTGASPSEETRASCGGLREQESIAEVLRGETERRSPEDASERASRLVDELVKMYMEAPESARWVRGATGWEI